ncbi:MAG TPA: aldo/keto reductase [Polyangia bacterium]|nr:aldo/keto reductase [Polyangia bacterium]
MIDPGLEASGTFSIGGDLPVHRLGFGAMRITGPGIWGEPPDHDEVVRTLRRVRELGIDFVDTADSYGPDVSERLLREVLHPYGRIRIATKGGFARTGPDRWVALGRPEYLIQQAEKSRRQLGVDRIDLWQLHRVDPKVPRDEQFDAVKSLLAAGVIRHAGLSEVQVDDIQAASKFFKVATVQNRYNVTDRRSEDVLQHCARQGIGFIPWYPLGAGDLSRGGAALAAIARRLGATVHQVALAWALRRSPVILPIPGTSQVAHLDENVAAGRLQLTDADMAALSG